MNDELNYPDRDPFLEYDEEAAARETRRLEREARRQGKPVPEPAPKPAAPPPLPPEPDPAAPLAAPAQPIDPGEAVTPAPASPETAETPAASSRPTATSTPTPPAPSLRDRAAVGLSGLSRPAWMSREPSSGSGSGPGGTDWMIWTRRLGALAIILLAIGLVVYAVTQVGGDEDPVAETPAKPLKTVSVTIPEGLTIEQIKPIAKDAGLSGDYVKAAEQALKSPPKGFPLDKYGAKGAPSLEGFLFPATYELEKGAPASDLVDKQLEAFQDNLAEVKLANAEDKNLNVYDVVKIASMVEREVQVAKERELVSAVIYNRLAAGDTLGIDATLRYELENYDEQLLQSELEAASPYNTRVTAGLPPTPIGNPGLDSLSAAANPANSDVYYFVVKPGTCGEHFFTADAAEFDSAAAEYQAALEAEGGSPTEC